MQELFERADGLTREMLLQQRLSHSALWQLVMANKGIADNLVLSLALAQNAVIILRFSWEPSHGSHLEGLVLFENYANTVMGSLQLLACIVVFLIYAIQKGPLRLQRDFKEAAPRLGLSQPAIMPTTVPPPHAQATGYDLEELCALPLEKWRLSYVLLLVYYTMSDTQLLLGASLILSSVLGLTLSPLWFSTHLLDVVNKSADLQNVFMAVTLNGRSIAMTALFGAIIIYLFAVVGYATDGSIFMLGNFPDPDVPMCTNLLSCFLNALNEGLRSGDIGSFMSPTTVDDVGGYAFRFAYQFAFWAIVITILLNVIFGSSPLESPRPPRISRRIGGTLPSRYHHRHVWRAALG